jgi:hypothetical protein
MRRFLTGWLTRAQDRGPRRDTPAVAPGRVVEGSDIPAPTIPAPVSPEAAGASVAFINRLEEWAPESRAAELAGLAEMNEAKNPASYHCRSWPRQIQEIIAEYGIESVRLVLNDTDIQDGGTGVLKKWVQQFGVNTPAKLRQKWAQIAGQIRAAEDQAEADKARGRK